MFSGVAMVRLLTIVFSLASFLGFQYLCYAHLALRAN